MRSSQEYTPNMGTRISHDGCFLSDGLRRVDYVIVIKQKSLEFLTIYISNLEYKGLDLEVAKGKKVERLFVLIHIPDNTLKLFSKIHDVGREEKVVLKTKKSPAFFRTEVSEIPPKEEGEFTTAERILIVHKMLEGTRYSEDDSDISLSKLIQQGVVETAYPLHDGSCEFGDSTLTFANDRQLLLTHWANFGVFYKESPIDLIQKYFGSKIAFYFAWLQFLNVMLLPVSIIGVIVIIVNTVLVLAYNEPISKDICALPNTTMLCPTCLDPNMCKFKAINANCVLSKVDAICDNRLNVAFAILMSFWATLFLQLWRRKSNKLKWKWGIKFEDKGGVRPEYADSAKWKYSMIHRRMVQYVPKAKIIASYVFSTLCVLLMMLMIFTVIVVVIVIKIIVVRLLKAAKYGRTGYKLVISTFGSISTLICIYVFSKLIYGKVIIWLTKIENPKTQVEFDNSVIYKKFVLAFFNNFSNTFYHAYVRGRFYTKPNVHHGFLMSTLHAHTCHPLTCMNDIAVCLTFLLIGRKTLNNLIKIVKAFIRKLTFSRDDFEDVASIPQFEVEYHLQPVGIYDLETKFCEMIMVYGFITFYAAAFPLAPLLGLIDILLEQRNEAKKYLEHFRRPVPYRTAGIGVWSGILTAYTLFSTVTNAFLIAFTSEIVSREVYLITQSRDGSLKGFYNTTLSAYIVKDFPLFRRIKPHPDICYYKSRRHSPWHPEKYTFSRNHWQDICWKFIIVFIYEHLIVFANVIFASFIPDVPHSVRRRMKLEKKLIKAGKLRALIEEMKSGTKGAITNRAVTRRPFGGTRGESVTHL